MFSVTRKIILFLVFSLLLNFLLIKPAFGGWTYYCCMFEVTELTGVCAPEYVGACYMPGYVWHPPMALDAVCHVPQGACAPAPTPAPSDEPPPPPPPTCADFGGVCQLSCDPGWVDSGVDKLCKSGVHCCVPAPTPTPTPNPSLPSIISLVVKNPSPTPTFLGLFGFSGNMITQSGSAWFNPMEITVNARPGTGNFLSVYVVAFYSGAKLENPSTFLTDVENRLNPYAGGNPKNGFLFAYDVLNQYSFIWDKTEFKPMPNNYQVKDTSGNLLMTGYKVGGSSIFANPGYATWKITLDKNFGSKTMYTAVMILDLINQFDFKSNITPQNN